MAKNMMRNQTASSATLCDDPDIQISQHKRCAGGGHYKFSFELENLKTLFFFH